MNNDQEWFNKNHPKTEKKIKLTSENFQEERLVIEDCLRLEKLYLRDIESINRLVLKNLPQLQECTVWNCGMQNLVIEKCPQLKKLNVRSNSLINLEFLANLESLEELEIDYNSEINSGLEHLPKTLKTFSCENTKIVEFLKPYQGDWKAYRIVELAKKRPRELLEAISDLREQNKRLKRELEEYNNSPQPFMLNDPIDFEKKYQKLKETLNLLLQEEQEKTEEIKPLEEAVATGIIVTEELIEKLKEQKKHLADLEKVNQELKEKFTPFEQVYQKIEQKKKELEEIKKKLVTDKAEVKDDLEDLLQAQKENNSRWLESCKRILHKRVTVEEINSLCYLQSQIVQLQKNFSQREKQINQIVSHINVQELIKLLIQKELKEENIEKMAFCNTWFSDNCALVISKKNQRKDKYRLWIAVHEPAFGKVEAEVKLIKVAEEIAPIKEKWTEITGHFKKALNSEYPAAELYNNAYTIKLPPLIKNYENIAKKKSENIIPN